MTTNKRRRLQAATVLVAASFLFSALLFWILPGVFGSWDKQTTDRLFQIRESTMPSRYDSSIVHIDIDNSSIKKLSYYFPRRKYAELIDVADRMDFSTLVFDIIFAQRQNTEDDALLLNSSRASGKCYFPIAFALETGSDAAPSLGAEETAFLDSTVWNLRASNTENFYTAGATLLTWTELSQTAHGVGFISVEADRDGVFRRVPLLIRYKNGFYPSVIFRAACDRFQVPPQNIEVFGGDWIVLHDAQVTAEIRKDISIPIDDRGNMLINWIGPWETMGHLSFARLLEAAEDQDEVDAYAERFSKSIGILGDVSTGISDIGPTPFEQKFPLVGLHAHTLNTILTQNFLREIPFPAFLLIEVLVAALLIFFAYRHSSLLLTISSIGLIILYLIGSAALFMFAHIEISIIHPILSISFSLLAVLAYRYMVEEKEKQQLRARFESYFPPAVVRLMLDNPETLSTAPRSTEVTIMFSDIKSFTTHSSHMTPEEISTTLSEYFEAMTAIVFKYGGTVDKFIGDGLMVFYGAPETQEDHALRCVRAAIEMQRKCRELKAKWEPVGRLPLKIRIGINTGPVVVGDLGSERRKEYTVLGSDVNLAQRLESNAPVEGIMISERTYTLIKDKVPTRPLEPIKVKGLDIPISVYEVLVEM